jgi:glyoxylase-like metal-dependent hydrolase (beta-lactamase superfamily II)
MKKDLIHKISIPTSFPSRQTNIYFIEGDVLTLIDTPPKANIYLDALNEALKNKGYTIRDIRRIIITHPHFDHFGAVADIVKLSNAEVWTSKGGAVYLRSFAAWQKDFEYYADVLRQAGVPGDLHVYLDHLYERARVYGCLTPVTRVLEEADKIDLGSATYIVRTVPGHSPWCILIHTEDRETAFSGDFLLKHRRPNAILQRPTATGPNYRSLQTYLASLQKIKQMAIRTVFPGHGEIIRDVSKRIDEIISSIERRKKLVSSILQQGPRKPFSIMQAVFSDLAPDQFLLGISEVVGQLELLEFEDSAFRREDGYWVRV